MKFFLKVVEAESKYLKGITKIEGAVSVDAGGGKSGWRIHNTEREGYYNII